MSAGHCFMSGSSDPKSDLAPTSTILSVCPQGMPLLIRNRIRR